MPSVQNKHISKFLRSLGLAWWGDYVRFLWMRFKNRRKNTTFKNHHPEAILPPDYMMYESFQMDYAKYYDGGREDAEWIISMAWPHANLTSGKILDWGCGPSRIIRHLPEILGDGNVYYGTDYNPKTIQWCKTHIQGIHYTVNEIDPPLPYAFGMFDLVYGISIFTHLSRENQQHWSNELHRIISPRGLVIVTTHGEAFMEKLTEEEQRIFQQGELVSRTKVKEGHRMYAAFEPPAYMRSVFTASGFRILEHLPGKRVHETYISQDVWMLKRE